MFQIFESVIYKTTSGEIFPLHVNLKIMSPRSERVDEPFVWGENFEFCNRF